MLLSLCVLLLCAARQLHGAANIDTVQLIVRSSPDRVREDDYGYAVVLHQVREPIEGDFRDALDSSRIIVGAPQGTYPGGLSLPVTDEPVSRTGLVYTCDVDRGTCSGLMGDPSSPNYQRMFDGEEDGRVMTGLVEEDEYKSGQLMGATLESSGDHFLVCAPRYQTNGTFRVLDNRRPVGRCFISGRELRDFVDYRPCLGANSIFSEGQDSKCVAGLSASLFPDSSTTFAALGAPGDADFEGNVYLYDLANDVTIAPEPSVTGINYNYEGYSVAGGNIVGRSSVDFLIGTPRFNGSVYNGSAFVHSRDSFSTVQPGFELIGETIGDYFGAAVATADLNGDGVDELLVGAPIYSSDSDPEVGRVYVYKNNGDGTVADPIRLQGQAANSRFGTSIVNLGDVNGDKFEDIAIGAPYFKDGGNTGAVYIYYGSMNGEIISTTPNQVLTASSVVDRVDGVSELKSFGFSLSSGVDVDNNAYNDLLVGAYESKTAILFRTQSVAEIEVEVDILEGPNISIASGVRSSELEFTVVVCATYTGRGLDGRRLDTTLIVRENGTSNRLRFGGKSEHKGPFRFDSTGTSTSGARPCQRITATIQPLSEQDPNIEVNTPYVVTVDFEQFDRPLSLTDGNDELIDLRDVPLLIPSGDLTDMVSLNLSCLGGPSNSCDADLSLTHVGFNYRSTQDGNPLPGVDSVVAGEVRFVDVLLRYTNRWDEPALRTAINFQIPDRFSRQATVRFENSPKPNAECVSDGRLFSCILDGFFARNEVSTIAIQLAVAQNPPIVGNERPVTFSASISVNSTDSTEVDDMDNSREVEIRFSARADLLVNSLTITGPTDYSSTLTGEVRSVNNLGRRVTFRASVRNGGPSTNPSARFSLSVPVGSSSGGLAHFYVFDIRVVGHDAVTCAPVNFMLNRDRFNITSSGARRRRAARLTKRQESTGLQTKVDCSDPSLRATNSCANVICEITDFTVKDFFVDVLAVVDRRFFSTQSRTFTYTAYASVESRTDFVSDPDPDNNIGESMPFVLVPESQEGGGVPVWIPIVCAIAALIVILIIAGILYFFGFFRRKRIKEQEAEGEEEQKGGVVVAAVPDEGGPKLDPIDENEDGDATPDNQASQDSGADGSGGSADGGSKDPDESSM